MAGPRSRSRARASWREPQSALGGTAATGVTVVSSTSITATTPAHAAGAVSVVVTNTDAQTGTLNNGFTYTTGTGGGGTIAFVQMTSSNPQTPAANMVLGFNLAQTAGNLNVVAVGWNDTTSTVSSVTDTRGNTYVQAGTTITGTGTAAGDLLRQEHCRRKQHGDGSV